MAKRHFSLPDRVMTWIEDQAAARDMRRSQFLAHLLTGIIDKDEEAAQRDRHPTDAGTK